MVTRALKPDASTVKIDVVPGGLVVLGAKQRMVALSAVASVRALGLLVRVELVPDETLARETFFASCSTPDEASELVARIDRARLAVVGGPFRAAI